MEFFSLKFKLLVKAQGSGLRAQKFGTECPRAQSPQPRALSIAILILLVSSLPSLAINPSFKLGVSETTPVAIVAEWPINSDTQEGEHFSAKVIEDVCNSAGEVIIPKNSRVLGTVVNVTSGGPFRVNGKVDINFEKILFPDNVTQLKISADGSLIKDKYETLKTIGQGLGEVAIGAALGGIAGFKFAGIMGTSTGTGYNVAIGAAAGAGFSLISFISRNGKGVEIYPGLPMTMKIAALQDQSYKAQKIIDITEKEISANILSSGDKKITVEIENNSENSIPLGNLKIVDALGYTVKPQIEYSFHNRKNIPASSVGKYHFNFSPTTTKTRYWLVLTDSFNKQEYFREELKTN